MPRAHDCPLGWPASSEEMIWGSPSPPPEPKRPVVMQKVGPVGTKKYGLPDYKRQKTWDMGVILGGCCYRALLMKGNVVDVGLVSMFRVKAPGSEGSGFGMDSMLTVWKKHIMSLYPSIPPLCQFISSLHPYSHITCPLSSLVNSPSIGNPTQSCSCL